MNLFGFLAGILFWFLIVMLIVGAAVSMFGINTHHFWDTMGTLAMVYVFLFLIGFLSEKLKK